MAAWSPLPQMSQNALVVVQQVVTRIHRQLGQRNRLGFVRKLEPR
jgi:hypothetical protein